MSASRPRMTSIFLLLSGLLFAYLMSIRTGIIHSRSLLRPFEQVQLSEKEFWLNIYQDGKKIGYTHRKLAHRDTGFFLSEQTRMRLNTMGMVHTIQVRTQASLDADLTLTNVDFSLHSHRFSFHATGKVEGKALVVSVNERKIRIPLDGPLYVTGVALDAAAVSELKSGETVAVPVFDPSTLGRRTIRVTRVGRESLEVMGRTVSAVKATVAVGGAVMTAWLNDAGEVLQEKGLLGLTLKRVSRQTALGRFAKEPGRDLTRLVSVAAGRTIDSPDRLSRLTVRIDGLGETLSPDGGRQIFKAGVLTVTREALPDPETVDSSTAKDYLGATPFVESDHPEIRKIAAEITAGAARPLEKARRLLAWVHDNIEKRPVISVPSALETLTHRQGDCNEHAVLLTALARAAGIPAQVEAGLVYLNGRFYYHAWNALFLGRWIPVDAVMNQMSADVTHLRLVRGDLRRQVDLMGVIGKISLEILDTMP